MWEDYESWCLSRDVGHFDAIVHTQAKGEE